MNQEERDLDQAIREKLDQFRPDSPLNWDRMEQRLQAEADRQTQDNNEAFDESIKNKISPHRIAFNPTHWRRMSALIDARAQWKTLLYRTKAIELGLMLLLFFTVYNLMPIATVSTVESNIQNTDNQVINKESKPKSTYNTALQYPNDTYHDLQNTAEQNVIITEYAENVNPKVAFVLSENPTSEAINTNHNSTENPPYFEDVEPHEFITEKEKLASVSILPLITKPIASQQKLAKVKARRVINGFANVLYFGQLNRVKIPSGSNNIFSTDAQYAVNQGFAINSGLAIGNNQLSTGLSYNTLTFVSKSRTTLVDGSAGMRERQVKTQTFSVPFNYAHTFNTGRFSPFVQVGVAAHFITKAKYDYNAVSFARAAATPPLAPTKPIPTLPDGLLNGGQWGNNAYMSADLGIGGTYKMTSHISLMSQIQYKHFMFNNGFGPNDNRINQLQLATGIQIK
jgi:hypothetical protein